MKRKGTWLRIALAALLAWFACFGQVTLGFADQQAQNRASAVPSTSLVDSTVCLTLFDNDLIDANGDVLDVTTFVMAAIGLELTNGEAIDVLAGGCVGLVNTDQADATSTAPVDVQPTDIPATDPADVETEAPATDIPATDPPATDAPATDAPSTTTTTDSTTSDEPIFEAAAFNAATCQSLFNANLLNADGSSKYTAGILRTLAGLNGITLSSADATAIANGGCVGLVATPAPTATAVVSVDICLSLFNAGLLDLSGNVTVASIPALVAAVLNAGLTIDLGVLINIFNGACRGNVPAPTATTAPPTATSVATNTTAPTATTAPTNTPVVTVDICLSLFNAGLLDLNGNVTVASLPELLTAVLNAGLTIDLGVLINIFNGGCAGTIPTATTAPPTATTAASSTTAPTNTTVPTSTPTVSVDICLSLFNAGLLDLNGNVTVASLPELLTAVLNAGLTIDLGVLINVFSGGCAGTIPTATVGPTGTSAVQTATAAATQTGTAAVPTSTPTVSVDICLSLFNAGLLDLNGNVTVASLPELLLAVTNAGLNIDLGVLINIFNGGCAGTIPTATVGPTGTSAVQTATAAATQTGTAAPTSTPTVSIDICLSLFNAGLLDLNGNVTVASVPALVVAVLNAGLTIDLGVLINVFNGGCAGTIPTATAGPTGTSAVQTATAQATQTVQPTSTPTVSVDICLTLFNAGLIDLNGNVTVASIPALLAAVLNAGLNIDIGVLINVFNGGCANNVPTATVGPTGTSAVQTATAQATQTIQPTASPTGTPPVVTCFYLISLGILDLNGNVTINTPLAIVVAVQGGLLELNPTVLFLIFGGGCVQSEPTPTATTEPTSTATTEPTATATATTEPTATETATATATATTEPTATATTEPTATATVEPTATTEPEGVTCATLISLGILDANGNVWLNTPVAIVIAVVNGDLELTPTVLFMIFGGGCVTEPTPTPTATATTEPTSTATTEPTATATETATATATATATETATATATATTEPTATATTEPTATATTEPEEVTCATLISLGILDANGNVWFNTPVAIVIAVINGDLELTPTVLYLIFSGVCVTEPTPTPTATATTEPTSTATTEPTSTATTEPTATATTEPTSTATTEPTATATETATATATTEPTATSTTEPTATATATAESAIVRVLVVNSDGSDLPDGLEACLDGTCQSLQIIAGVGMLALQLPSGSGAYFYDVAPGGHTAEAQAANGDVLGTAPVTAVAGETTTVTIVLHKDGGTTGSKVTPVAVTSLPTTGGGSMDHSSSLVLMLLAAAGSLLLGTLWARRRHR